jgi:hypothetical protein
MVRPAKLPPKKETSCSGGKWIFASPADTLAVLIASKAIIIPTAPAGFLIPIKTDKNALSPVRFPAIFIEICAFLYVFMLRKSRCLSRPADFPGGYCMRNLSSWDLAITYIARMAALKKSEKILARHRHRDSK